jgi:hypothetical protein
MKIAVFSTPRTCSTFICQIISNKFNIINHGEKVYGNFSGNKDATFNFLKTHNDYVIKLFAKYFYNDLYINQTEFDWDIFDYIFITQRQNLTDQMASVYNVHYYDQTHIDLNSPEVLELYNNQKQWIQLFYDVKRHLLQTYNNVFVVDYEELQNNTVDYLNSVTNLEFTEEHMTMEHKSINSNYQQQYDNYQELQQLVDSWNIIQS